MMFPMELITLLGSTAIGGVIQLLSSWTESKKQQQMALIQMANIKATVYKDAREYDNKGFQWTRRIIAILTVIAVMVWPKVAPLLGLPVTVGYTEFHPGFLFVEGKDTVTWKLLTGIVITPLDTHFLSAIAGLYFGGSLAKAK